MLTSEDLKSVFRETQMGFNDWFSAVPRFETERCLLRPFTAADMERYFEILRKPEVQRYLGGGVPLFDREPHITNWLNNINGRLLKSKLVFTFCVCERQSGQVIGRIDLGGFKKKTFAEIAYHFDSEYWGKGLATETAKRVTDFGMNELKLHRIQGLVRTENIASIRVLEKCGYQREGVLRKYPFGREFHDAVMLAIVNENNLKEKNI